MSRSLASIAVTFLPSISIVPSVGFSNPAIRFKDRELGVLLDVSGETYDEVVNDESVESIIFDLPYMVKMSWGNVKSKVKI